MGKVFIGNDTDVLDIETILRIVLSYESKFNEKYVAIYKIIFLKEILVSDNRTIYNLNKSFDKYFA